VQNCNFALHKPRSPLGSVSLIKLFIEQLSYLVRNKLKVIQLANHSLKQPRSCSDKSKICIRCMSVTGSRLKSRFYLIILVTTPAPMVLPPSRITSLIPSSTAIGSSNSTLKTALSPGRTASIPSGSITLPVTSTVLI